MLAFSAGMGGSGWSHTAATTNIPLLCFEIPIYSHRKSYHWHWNS